MKKVIALLVSSCLIIGMAGCTSKEVPNNSSKQESSENNSVQESSVVETSLPESSEPQSSEPTSDVEVTDVSLDFQDITITIPSTATFVESDSNTTTVTIEEKKALILLTCVESDFEEESSKKVFEKAMNKAMLDSVESNTVVDEGSVEIAGIDAQVMTVTGKSNGQSVASMCISFHHKSQLYTLMYLGVTSSEQASENLNVFSNAVETVIIK